MKIISGGQIGADIAGLRAAQEIGFETGGWMPKNFTTLDGPHPEYAEMYGLIETADGGYPIRTRLNVKAADVTLRFAYNFMTHGEKLTARCIRELKRPHLDILVNLETSECYPASSYVTDWVVVYMPKIINIAGNAKRDLEPIVQDFLNRVFRTYRMYLKDGQ